MQKLIIFMIMFISSLALAEEVTGVVSFIKAKNDYTSTITLTDGNSYSIEACAGLIVSDGERSRARCSKNSMIFSLLQSSLISDMPVTIELNKKGWIESASISK